MDRRHFIQTLLGTSLLTPFLSATRTSAGDSEIYLLSDQPHAYLLPLLEELRESHIQRKKTFSFLSLHPCQRELKHLLQQHGWLSGANLAQAGMTLSFCRLQKRALPSFTLVKNGRILDIRSRRLLSLWQSMNRNNSPSHLVTVATFHKRTVLPQAGELVSLYRNGHRIVQRPLRGNWTQHIQGQEGTISVRMQDGNVWISESSCRHKICVSAPPVSLAGERIICAPNHFLLEIQGRSIDTVIG